MENIICVKFKVESEAYQAMTELKKTAVNDLYVISQAALVKKAGGQLVTVDGFDTGSHTEDDTLTGGLVGGLVGILGGPIGMLVCGSMGALAGGVVDAHEAAAGVTTIEEVGGKLLDGDVAIIALVQEDAFEPLDAAFLKYETFIIRRDAAEVADEIRQAKELQEEMEREARKKLREEKKNERKEKIEEQKAKLKADFEALKAKHKK